MQKIIYFVAPFLLITLFVFNLPLKASAQTEAETTVGVVTETRAGLLPTNPFYFLKEWRRSWQRFFTREPVAKTELEIKILEERATEIRKLEERGARLNALERSIANFETARGRLVETLESLPSIDINPRVGEIIERIGNQTLRHIELIKSIETKLQVRKEVEETKQKKKQREESEKTVNGQEKNTNLNEDDNDLNNLKDLEGVVNELDLFEEETKKPKEGDYTTTPCGPEPQLASPPEGCKWMIRCADRNWDTKLVCEKANNEAD